MLRKDSELREEVSPLTLLSAVGVVVVARVFFDISWGTVAVVIVSGLLSQTLELNRSRFDRRYVKVAVGVGVVTASLGMGYISFSGDSGELWLPAVLLVFGVWILLDGLADFYDRSSPGSRHDEMEDLSSTDLFLLMSHSHLIADKLRDRPQDIESLSKECELTESRVKEAIEYLVDSGVVHREEEKYVLDETETGLVAFVRKTLIGFVRRAIRPVSVIR
ncbi:MAG: hypothetical protein SV253_06385 [Halobacteria archaeon]|nr:hypothetical protein [Halobacteria archaeon]